MTGTGMKKPLVFNMLRLLHSNRLVTHMQKPVRARDKSTYAEYEVHVRRR